MMILGYVALFAMGVVLSLMGAGGSILVVPILVYLFGIDPLIATTDSLLIVGILSAVSGYSFFIKKDFDKMSMTYFLIPSLLGVVATRAYVLPILPDTFLGDLPKSQFIMLLFSQLMLGAALSMFKKGEPQSNPSLQRASFVGVVVGAITSLVGAGGGFLIIPALVVFLKVPMKRAVGSSLLMITLNSFLGYIVSLMKGFESNFESLMVYILIALLGVGVGLKLSGKIPEDKLKKSFATFVLIMSIVLLIKNWP
jgi:uncharacterized membrane protein YfcA